MVYVYIYKYEMVISVYTKINCFTGSVHSIEELNLRKMLYQTSNNLNRSSLKARMSLAYFQSWKSVFNWKSTSSCFNLRKSLTNV